MHSLASFDKWLLGIGDGTLDYTNEEGTIHILDDILVNGGNDPMKEIVELTNLNFIDSFGDQFYHEEKAILIAKNDTIGGTNDFFMIDYLDSRFSI